MQSKWDERSYRWFRDSSEYTGYDRKLSEILLDKMDEYEEKSAVEAVRTKPAVEAVRAKLSSGEAHKSASGGKYGTLCDMGCGAGEIDLVLAPFFEKVTCVDIDPDVIGRLKNTLEERKITNVRALVSDGSNIEDHFDRVIAIYHARSIDRIRKYLKLADKQLILVVRESKMTEVGLNRTRALECFDSASMKSSLDEAGIKYEFSSHSIEHGQPFRNYEDAAAFVMRSCEIEDLKTAEEYLESKLVQTGEEKFPYYLPKMKHMGIFVINTVDSDPEEVF